MTEQPLKIEFSQEKIVEAIQLLTKIHVNKDSIKHLSEDDVDKIAYDVIYETCSAIMHTLKDEDKRQAVLNQLIKDSNLKYLLREPKVPYLH